jgi:hypothetical protein
MYLALFPIDVSIPDGKDVRFTIVLSDLESNKTFHYHLGNGFCPENGGHIGEGCWYVETIGDFPFVVQRCKSFVQANAGETVFWHKKAG